MYDTSVAALGSDVTARNNDIAFIALSFKFGLIKLYCKLLCIILVMIGISEC